MLAHAGQNERLAFFQKNHLEKYTAQTIVSSGGLMEHLQAIRDQGSAVDCEEFEPGMCGVAAPVHNFAAKVIGAVGLVGPSSRLASEKLHGELTRLVVGAAQAISLRLGYQKLGVSPVSHGQEGC
jgi:IclR family acetate operon transcriptional repressor